MLLYPQLNSYKRMSLAIRTEMDITSFISTNVQGDFFNWASPENVSRLAPPKFAWSGPP